jgi:hypothetical protein
VIDGGWTERLFNVVQEASQQSSGPYEQAAIEVLLEGP